MAAEPYHALLYRIKSGDDAAFRELYEMYYAGLWDYAVRYLGEPQAAEDVVHDVFQDVWERRGTLGNVAIKPYLFAAVRNRALQLLRHQGVVARAHKDMDIDVLHAPVDPAFLAVDIEATAATRIAALPPRTQQLFLLRWKYQMSYPEVAEVLGISTEAAKKLGQRVAAALKDLLVDLK